MWGRRGRGAVLKAMLVDSDGILDVKNDLMSLAKHEGSEEALERSCAEETQDDASLIAAHVQVRCEKQAWYQRDRNEVFFLWLKTSQPRFQHLEWC